MSGSEIIEQLDVIQDLCLKLAESMHEAKAQGRMPSLEEVRRMDVLSERLTESIQSLPLNPCEMIDRIEVRQRAADLLKCASELLAPLLPTSSARTAARMPAAASRLAAYGTL
jgi:hypothetical protein